MSRVRVGLVGTGYAAKLRAETIQADDRSQLIAVAGHQAETAQAFCAPYGAEAMESWEALVGRSDVDLVIVATVNRLHGAVARAALTAGKHVVVEYPLALDVSEAEALVKLATAQGKLLHVEHIELLSGSHRAVQAVLPTIARPFYVRSSSLNAQHPAPRKWTYDPLLFGFPLLGAVSRIHRLTDLFSAVQTVSCQADYWGNRDGCYASCLCSAHLRFASGLVAELVYGKGEAIWQSARTLEIHGEQGGIFITGEQGTLVQADRTQAIEIGSRRGLFAQDTRCVLDHLLTGAPLYVTPAASLYALKVADAARRSAETGQVITIS